MLELKDVRYAYPQAPGFALDGVSADCRPGRCLMVTGPSGAGKTTLCLAAAGVLHHEFGGSLNGSIVVAGKDIGTYASLADIARVVGISFDDPDAQLIFTTVEEEILTALECRGLPPSEVERRLETILAETRLGPLRNRAPHTLSGGQKQRLVLAATLALGTDVLILDEPTSELDDQGTAAIVEILRELKDRGRTILLVEHKWNGLAPLVDDLLVLDGGRVTATGAPSALLDDPSIRSMLVPDYTGIGTQAARPSLGPPIIQATDLVHRYGDVTALQNVSLAIRRGEIVALVGENGSGKTTLIKHFNGLLKPTSGRVVVNGIDTMDATVAELSRQVGLVFQNPDHMFFRDTVREEVAFGPENLGITDLDASVDRALREVRLEGVQHLYPRWLSRGERQRLAIACILAMQPPVIALDEPTTGLDGREAREIMAIVHDLRGAGHTIVMITHSRDIALACTDRIVTMAGGRIANDRSAGEGEE